LDLINLRIISEEFVITFAYDDRRVSQRIFSLVAHRISRSNALKIVSFFLADDTAHAHARAIPDDRAISAMHLPHVQGQSGRSTAFTACFALASFSRARTFYREIADRVQEAVEAPARKCVQSIIDVMQCITLHLFALLICRD
jgi:hypothetical protein